MQAILMSKGKYKGHVRLTRTNAFSFASVRYMAQFVASRAYDFDIATAEKVADAFNVGNQRDVYLTPRQVGDLQDVITLYCHYVPVAHGVARLYRDAANSLNSVLLYGGPTTIGLWAGEQDSIPEGD